MPHEVVTAAGIAPSSGPFAPATLATGTRVLTLSGQIADDSEGKRVGDEAGEQARQCLRNIDALLQAAGASRTDIVRIGVYLTDMADRGAVALARSEFFGEHKPASTLFQVAALVAPEYRVEIEATAIF